MLRQQVPRSEPFSNCDGSLALGVLFSRDELEKILEDASTQTLVPRSLVRLTMVKTTAHLCYYR